MAKKQGDWMNETNIKTNLAGLLDYTYNPIQVSLDIPHKDLTFKGYRRKNGDVGVRNNWLKDCVAKPKAREWMPLSLSHTTTVAHNLVTTTKIRKRFFATWYSTPMQVLCW